MGEDAMPDTVQDTTPTHMVTPSMQTFFIPMRLPDLNSMLRAKRYYRGGGDRYSKSKKQHQQYIADCIKEAQIKPLEKAGFIFTWRECARRRDKDNIAAGMKYILDALVQTKVLPGDGWRHLCGFIHEFGVDRDRPGVLVDIVDGSLYEAMSKQIKTIVDKYRDTYTDRYWPIIQTKTDYLKGSKGFR